jgi:branched-chain amino acid transport system permease protein
VFGIVGVMNWTHGEIYMLGAFSGYFLCRAGTPLIPALLVSMIIGAVLAMLVDHIGYRPLRKKRKLASAGFITALGLSTFLRYSATAAFLPNSRAYPDMINYRQIQLFALGGRQLTISSIHLIILAGTIALMVILQLFISKTITGKAMLAASQDMQTLGLMGVDSEKLIKITFAISGALGAAAGVFVGIVYSINPSMGALAGLKGWSVAILGGIGSITGSLIGGLILGVAEGLTAGFISTGYKDAIGFIIMMAVLLIKPTGLMGYKFEDKV